MSKDAHINGKVEYREGDGANITIRPGPCQVEETALDVTISWTDGDTRGSAAIPVARARGGHRLGRLGHLLHDWKPSAKVMGIRSPG